MNEQSHPKLWTNATAALNALHATPEARAAIPADAVTALCDAVSWGQRMEWERDQQAASAASLDESLRKALDRIATLERETERLRHGSAIEGDTVCPAELAISNHADRLQTVVDEAWGPIEVLDLEHLISEVERRAYADRREFVAMRENAARLDAECKKALTRVVELGAELARVTGEQDAALQRAEKAERETVTMREAAYRNVDRWGKAESALTRAREALGYAAGALEQIATAGGRNRFLPDLDEVRTYAGLRAGDARAALADATEGA